MSNPSDPFSILNRNADKGGFNLPKPKPKIQKYVRGKAPEMADREEDDDDDYSAKEISHYTFDTDKNSVAESSREEEQALAEKLARRRKIHSTVVIEEAKKEEAKENKPKENIEKSAPEMKPPEIVERRSRINKEKLMEREEVHEDDILLQKIQEEDEVAEVPEEEDENATAPITLLKPVFVSKKERESNDTLAVKS
jgi:hypothetical protein